MSVYHMLQCYTSTRRLRIGYYDDDGYCPVVPAIKRAVHLAKAALEKQGHEVNVHDKKCLLSIYVCIQILFVK